MLIVEWYKIPVFLSLGVVASILAISMAASWLIPEKAAEESVEAKTKSD